MLGIGFGLQRSVFTYVMNMQFMCKKNYYLFSYLQQNQWVITFTNSPREASMFLSIITICQNIGALNIRDEQVMQGKPQKIRQILKVPSGQIGSA